MIGSVAYLSLSEEYDDLNKKIKISAKVEQNCLEEVTKLKRNVHKIIKRQNFAEDELERLEQYGHRENLEIHGVPITPNENTNQIAKKSLILLDDKQISTSYGLKTNSNNHVDKSKQKVHPCTIVCFSNRDKRNEFFRK